MNLVRPPGPPDSTHGVWSKFSQDWVALGTEEEMTKQAALANAGWRGNDYEVRKRDDRSDA